MRYLSPYEEAQLLKRWTKQEWGGNLKPVVESFTHPEAVELMNQYQIEWGEYVTAHYQTKRQDDNSSLPYGVGTDLGWPEKRVPAGLRRRGWRYIKGGKE